MGQYWKAVNIDKREFVHPHKLGAGLKLGEQLGTHPGTSTALLILLSSYTEKRGGGDPDLDENWWGLNRHSNIDKYPGSPAPFSIPDYPAIAKRTWGRWAGDRVIVVGDYAKDEDWPDSPIPMSQLYERCLGEADLDNEQYVARCAEAAGMTVEDFRKQCFTDISGDVCTVIEHELWGTFEGKGWRRWERKNLPKG